MRAVVQRVLSASVEVESEVIASIGTGLLILLGIAQGDTEQDAHQLTRKITHLRIFPDESGKMNRSLLDLGRSLLIVSQFTLYGDARKGNRPSYSRAAPPDFAEYLYERFIAECRSTGLSTSTGIFQGHMQVYLVNDGPVTLIIDTEQ